MIHLKGRCPVCSEKSGFHIFHLGPYRMDGPASLCERKNSCRGQPPIPAKIFACGCCMNCNHPVLAELGVDQNMLRELQDCLEHGEKIYDGKEPEIRRLLPEKIPVYSHPSLPDDVRILFVDLQDMCREKKTPSRIVAGCRSVLEASVKHLEGKGNTLSQRLNDLKEKAVISGVLWDWSTHIRLEGNEAVHEINASPEDAAELVDFTKIFLHYAFEMPARIRDLSGQHA